MSRIIKKSGADIVHTRNWGAFDGVLASCLHPRVIVFHGEHGRDISDPKGLNRRRNRIRRLMSFRIRKFTTVSQDLARWLTGTVGIRPGKVVIITNGVDTDRFRPRRDAALREELGIGPDEFVIGTIGRLDPVKNQAGLVRAFAIAAAKMPRARLIVVGDGPERDRLRDQIAGLQEIRPPLLCGYRPDVERFYGVFDLFVLNSFAEGMSNTLLEAMACGLPILCTPVGANAEIVKNGEQGAYVAIGDDAGLAEAILEHAHSPDLRILHGTRARGHIMESHSLEIMIRRYVRLFASRGSGREA